MVKKKLWFIALAVIALGVLLAPTIGEAAIDGQGVWLLDEGTGTNASDSSVNSNSGLVVNATWSTNHPSITNADYPSNHSLSFDGDMDYVVVSDDSTLDITNAITIEAWVKPVSALATQAVLYKSRDTATIEGCYNLMLVSGYPRLQFGIGGSSVLVQATTRVTAGQWNYMAGTYDGTNMVVYSNPTSANDYVSYGKTGTIMTSDADLSLGMRRRIGTGGSYIYELPLNGGLDEVRVMSTALSGADIYSSSQQSLVPEPSIMALLGFGGVFWLLVLRRYRRR